MTRRKCGRLLTRSITLRLLALMIAVLFAGSRVRAEEFHLRSGGVLHGKWINKNESSPNAGSPQRYVIEIESGMKIVLSATQVKSVDELDEFESKYELNLGKLEDTANAHRMLVDQLSSDSMESVANAHRERFVELAPNDARIAGMWSKLGYNQDSNKEWVREEILAHREGLVLFKSTGGRYPRPQIRQNIVIDDDEQDVKDKQKILNDKLEIAFRNEAQTNSRGDNARKFLAELNDPLAIDPLAKALVKARMDSKPVQVRLRLIDMIAKYQRAAAFELLDSAIHDPDSMVRDRCIDHLKKYAPDFAVARCVAQLRSNSAPNRAKMSVDEIDRIGDILSAIPDERAVRALIEALNITRIETVAGTPGAQAGPGGINLSRGGPKAIAKVAGQTGILQALLKQSGDANYQYDQAKWREWYAITHASTGLDVRRDP